mmetsp:Transcript_19194/g.41458  ORF Transcript_19194/g.41458 Transcript_19194/m.41458 type:complete len:278 (+) Transcript_19194:70-903(+)
MLGRLAPRAPALRKTLPKLARVAASPVVRLSTTITPDSTAEQPRAIEALPSRTRATIEVIASKIFPAGFGWQAASVVAGQQGFDADTMAFALTTGAGDFVGVFAGHSLYSVGKAALTGKSSSLPSDMTTGLWLATAAFCSGTSWQPIVNFLHDDAGCSFASTAVGCGTVTGLSFFIGLRIGRIIYAPLGLPRADYANLCGDAMLSASIGAATGTFVGTDVSFPDNVLLPAFGVTDNMSDLEGMVRAGASTSAGFLCMQTLQNVTLPRGSNWLDPVKL